MIKKYFVSKKNKDFDTSLDKVDSIKNLIIIKIIKKDKSTYVYDLILERQRENIKYTNPLKFF